MSNSNDKMKFSVYLSRQITEGYIVDIEADSIEDANRLAGEVLRDFIVDIERNQLNIKPVSIGEHRDAMLSDQKDLMINVECADLAGDVPNEESQNKQDYFINNNGWENLVWVNNIKKFA